MSLIRKLEFGIGKTAIGMAHDTVSGNPHEFTSGTIPTLHFIEVKPGPVGTEKVNPEKTSEDSVIFRFHNSAGLAALRSKLDQIEADLKRRGL